MFLSFKTFFSFKNFWIVNAHLFSWGGNSQKMTMWFCYEVNVLRSARISIQNC